ncbi:MAG: HutD family protein [Bacteroidetes bacterium]|nr:HutD family protein [Bacteroidota bacterium]HET6244239.1 HutD family protein [Bacteroidia bacterium]
MFELTKQSELKTANWAGGTTTQLAIFPKRAEYQKFDFDFRISFATVEVEESTFTFMPGVTRHLMVLDGSLELEHINRNKIVLNKFDTTTFFGEWPTKAKGKIRDFNLMTRGLTQGKLELLELNEGETDKVLLEKQQSYMGIYLLNGKLDFNYNQQVVTLEKGDFVLMNGFTNSSFFIAALNFCQVIVCRITNIKQGEK